MLYDSSQSPLISKPSVDIQKIFCFPQLLAIASTIAILAIKKAITSDPENPNVQRKE